jgi:putative NADH-flavin reductase
MRVLVYRVQERSCNRFHFVFVFAAFCNAPQVLVRKLLLRGYNVRAMVREKTMQNAVGELLPQKVEVVIGDIGDYKSCRKAMEGVDKVRGWGNVPQHSPVA